MDSVRVYLRVFVLHTPPPAHHFTHSCVCAVGVRFHGINESIDYVSVCVMDLSKYTCTCMRVMHDRVSTIRSCIKLNWGLKELEFALKQIKVT